VKERAAAALFWLAAVLVTAIAFGVPRLIP